MSIDNTLRLRAIIKKHRDICEEQEKKFELSMLEPEGMNSWDLAHSKRKMIDEILSEFDAVTRGG